MAAPKKKRWKWSEHDEYKQQQPEPERTRSGTCLKCGYGSFTLKIEKGRMDRICKDCGDVVKNI